jgi:hypothetical protein
MTTTNAPDVPVPAGFWADVWQNGFPLSHRVLLGEVRAVDGVDVCVQASAVQFSDGRIDDGSVYERPHVHLGDDTLTAMQARELAALLIEAADELDRLNA